MGTDRVFFFSNFKYNCLNEIQNILIYIYIFTNRDILYDDKMLIKLHKFNKNIKLNWKLFLKLS
jgi:hypothetical protein